MSDERPLRKCALYVRVSTGEQDLDHQEEDLRAEAGRRGWEVVGVYRDRASGGGPAARRPGLAELRHHAALRRFRAVLVWSVSRLGRNVLELLAVAEELKEHGVGLVSYREPAIDTTGAMGRMVLQIGAAFAEFERAELSARTKSGMAGAARRGARIGRPPVPVKPEQVAYLVRLHGPGTGGISMAARSLNISRSTVKRLLAKAKEASPAAGNGPPGSKRG